MEINLEYTRAFVQVKVTKVYLTHKVKACRGQTKVVNSVESSLHGQNTWLLRRLCHPLDVCHCSGYLAPPSHLVQLGGNDMPVSEVGNHTSPMLIRGLVCAIVLAFHPFCDLLYRL